MLSVTSERFVYDSGTGTPICKSLRQHESSTSLVSYGEKDANRILRNACPIFKLCNESQHNVTQPYIKVKEKSSQFTKSYFPSAAPPKEAASTVPQPALKEDFLAGLLHYCSPFPPIRFQTHHRKAEAFQPLGSLIVKDAVCGTVHSDNNVILLAPGVVTRWGLLENHRHHRNVLFHLTTQPEKTRAEF